MTTYDGYEEAKADYLTQCRALRGSEDFVDTADAMADISAAMLPLGADYLADENPIVRVGISSQLLAQATVELEVATALLQLAERGEAVAETAVNPVAAASAKTRAFPS